MKRILLILFFISIINVSYGQTNVYHKFSSTFANWSGTFRGTNISNCYKYNYTLIGAGQYSYISVNKVYYPLSISGPTQWVCDFNTQQFSSFKEGWIREDTLSRKIYFSEIDYSNETLIYDFSLNIGDTLKSSLFTGFPNVASNITVTAIDSILIGDSYRKQWTIHGFSALSQGKMIEGVGSLFGLLEPLADFEKSSNLECYEEDGVNKYSSDSISCPLPLNVNSNSKKEIAVIVFPSPSKGEMTISQLVKLYSFFEIYDMNNQLILKGNLSSKQQTIDVSDYQEGMYLVKLIGRQKVEFKKIMVVK